jgi:1-acyl-sn-glycerol-3-phosphate acyltransferase
MSPLRLAFRAGAAVLVFLVCAPLHLLTKALTGRSDWPQRFLAGVTRALGVRVRAIGAPAAAHTLLLPNHVSWIDILALSGATGCAFVSKDQLGHPLIHWLADQNGTVYVKRSHVKGAKDQAAALGQALERGQPVAVFPEGTVGPGDRLLPFRSTLIEAVNLAGKDVTVRPVAIDYGAAAADIAWYQEPVLRNIRRVLGRKGSLDVTLHLLAPLDKSGDRKAMAAAARAAIADSLGFTGDQQPPIGAER